MAIHSISHTLSSGHSLSSDASDFVQSLTILWQGNDQIYTSCLKSQDKPSCSQMKQRLKRHTLFIPYLCMMSSFAVVVTLAHSRVQRCSPRQVLHCHQRHGGLHAHGCPQQVLQHLQDTQQSNAVCGPCTSWLPTAGTPTPAGRTTE